MPGRYRGRALGGWVVILTCTIPGQPVGKGRPRASIRGFGTPKAHIHMRTPEKTATWEATAAWHLRGKWAGKAPLDQPVAVTVWAVGQRPKAEIPGPRTLAKHPELANRLWRPTKPDIDNVVKAALDALVNAGVIRDDVLVVDVRGLSLWAALSEGPQVVIEVREVERLGIGGTP